MKILLTGSQGLIGRSLSMFLKEKGAEVIPYDPKENPRNNILDFDNLKKEAAEADGIIHLAALTQPKTAYEKPRDCVNINIVGTANILEVARNSEKRPWVIFISSREVFGEGAALPIREDTPRNPATIYGLTKFIGEDFCKNYSEGYGLKTRILRLTSVYGENDFQDRVIPKFVSLATKGDPLVIYGTGEETFDFTYVEDIVEGIWQTISETERSQKTHDDFILSFGSPVSLKDLAETIIKETGSSSQIKYEKKPHFSTTKCYADHSKAKDVLGFQPKTDIRQGIKLIIKNIKNKNK